MSKKTKLTPAVIEQVWSLYSLGYTETEIMKKLRISMTSVQRCVVAMRTASEGKVVDYDGILRDSHHIADYANTRFGLKSAYSESTLLNENMDLAAAINNLASCINKQTTLLETFFIKLRS